MKIDLCILTWNEIEGITTLLPQIDRSLFNNVFAVDPGSEDGTIEFFEKNEIKCFIQEKKGRGNAFREAFNMTSDNDAIVFFSGDGNEDPSDLHLMVKHLEEGFDLVIGGRFIRKGSQSDNSDDRLRIRKFGNIIFSLVTRTVWKTGVFDSINGYRGIRRDAMHLMNTDADKHEIELQSTIRAAKLKLKIKEFPTKELRRIADDRSQTANTFTLGKTLSKTFIKELFLRKKFLQK